MAAATTTVPGAGGADKAGMLADPGNPLAALIPLLTQQQRTQTTAGGSGDVSGLQALLAQLMPTTAPGGMDPVIRALFQQGFEKQMPQLYNMANTAGVRPGSSTQQQLMLNDLNARLAAEGAKAIATQQQTAGQVASSIAQNTKTPTVTKAADRTTIDPKNALLGAALLAGAKLYSGMNKPAAGSTEAKAATDEQLFGKKRTGGMTEDIIGSILGGNDIFDTTANVLKMPTSTGGINPTMNFGGGGGGGAPSWNSFGSSGPGTGDAVSNFITSLISGNDIGTSASGAAGRYATAAIPVVGPYVAAAQTVGDLLGVNEITSVTDSITNTIGDIGSAIVKPFGCYITTAICELDGKPDDCEELQTLRTFRDDWLATQPGGKELIKQYYDQAPRFLAALAHTNYKEQILRNFQDVFITPAVHAAKIGDNQTAFKLYVNMLEEANGYIQHMGS